MRQGATVGRRIFRGLTVAVRGFVWLLGALTLFAFLDRFSSYMELLTFFRVQYAVLLLLAALVALAVRLPRVALAALVLTGVNLVVVGPTWISPRTEAGTALGSLSLLLINLQSGNTQHADVSRLIAKTDPDVIGLIELTPRWADALAPALSRFPSRRLETQDGAYGIGLYSKSSFREAKVEHFAGDAAPSVVARFDLGEGPFTLVLTHVHTPFAGDVHRRQLEALADARKALGERVAICGDFNAVPWSSSFRHLVSAADLTDSHEGHWLEGSWPSWGPLLRVPLDNCLISSGVAVIERKRGDGVGSDHFPLIIRFGSVESSTEHSIVGSD
jgi:endonuclease/exonuclease/phosphatase (EEP) superfamily protein YafD